MKRLQGLIAATFITAIVAVGTVGIGINALSNPNSVAVSNSPAQDCASGSGFEQSRNRSDLGADRSVAESDQAISKPRAAVSDGNQIALAETLRCQCDRLNRRSRCYRLYRSVALSKSRAMGASSCAAINGAYTRWRYAASASLSCPVLSPCPPRCGGGAPGVSGIRRLISDLLRSNCWIPARYASTRE